MPKKNRTDLPPEPIPISEPIPVKLRAICGVDRRDFEQPGKELHGKWICPNCVQSI